MMHTAIITPANICFTIDTIFRSEALYYGKIVKISLLSVAPPFSPTSELDRFVCPGAELGPPASLLLGPLGWSCKLLFQIVSNDNH